MIEVQIRADGIDVNGHAHYGPKGRDVVCAGVTALVQELVESFDALTADNIKSEVSPGRVKIQYKNLSARGILLVDSFSVGIKIIADEYPDYVRIVQA